MTPGPASVPPASCPGGWLIHVYDSRGGLVLVRALYAGIRNLEPDVAAADRRFVATVAPGPTSIVIYDGDSGERWGMFGPAAWGELGGIHDN